MGLEILNKKTRTHIAVPAPQPLLSGPLYSSSKGKVVYFLN